MVSITVPPSMVDFTFTTVLERRAHVPNDVLGVSIRDGRRENIPALTSYSTAVPVRCTRTDVDLRYEFTNFLTEKTGSGTIGFVHCAAAKQTYAGVKA